MPERRAPSGPAWSSAALISLAGIAVAYRALHAPARRHARSCATASRACTTSSSHKWYFDELYDAAVRAARSPPSARFGRRVIESALRAGLHRRRRDRRRARGHRRSRARSRPATCAPTRCCSLIGVAGPRPLLPAASARDDPPLDRALPAAGRRRCSARFLPRALARWAVLAGSASRCWPTWSSLLIDFEPGGGPAVRDRRQVDPGARASATSSGSTGSTCS